MSLPLTLEFDQTLAIITFTNPARGNALDLVGGEALAIEIISTELGAGTGMIVDVDGAADVVEEGACRDDHLTGHV